MLVDQGCLGAVMTHPGLEIGQTRPALGRKGVAGMAQVMNMQAIDAESSPAMTTTPTA
jgi:hypothetical protein